MGALMADGEIFGDREQVHAMPVENRQLQEGIAAICAQP